VFFPNNEDQFRKVGEEDRGKGVWGCAIPDFGLLRPVSGTPGGFRATLVRIVPPKTGQNGAEKGRFLRFLVVFASGQMGYVLGDKGHFWLVATWLKSVKTTGPPTSSGE
jgi:hypothetical protein